MIVQRSIVHVKPGHGRNELVDLVLAEEAAFERHLDHPWSFRVYTPGYSGQPNTQVVLEWEYQDIAERDRLWNEWRQLPTTPAFREKRNELVAPGAINEIWNVRTL